VDTQTDCYYDDGLLVCDSTYSDEYKSTNSIIKGISSFMLECETRGGKEVYMHCCHLKKRNGVMWLRFGIWNLRGIRRGAGKGTCPLHKAEENEMHRLLKCKDKQRLRGGGRCYIF
jgi:hypothetical protein